MKIHKVTAVLLVGFGCSVMSTIAISADKDHRGQSNKGSGAVTTRAKTVAETGQKTPKKYEEIIEALKEEENGKPAIAFCGTEYLIDNGGAEKLQKHFETLAKYRSSLNDCSDKASEQLKGLLDSYTDKMIIDARAEGNGESLEAIAKKSKSIQGMDSALRFHEVIKEFLAKKEKEQATDKTKFAEADEGFKKAIDGIFRWCQKPGKEFKPSKDAKTTHEIENFSSQIGKLNLAEIEVCELNAPAAPVLDENQRVAKEEEAGSDKKEEREEKQEVERNTAPPTGDPKVAQDATPGAQPGQAGGVATGPGSLPLPISGGQGFIPGQGDASIVDPALFNNGLEREDALIRQIGQLAAQAGQPNRIGGSPDNSRSFQFPPVSVQPGQQNPQQQQPQQPYPPMQQMPPFPYGAMMQPPVPTPIPAELLNPSRNDSAARTSPNDAAQTQALLEMAKLQQQMMQQTQLANQMAYAPMGATSNANRLRNSRTAFRGSRSGSGSRFVTRGSRKMARTIGSSVR